MGGKPSKQINLPDLNLKMVLIGSGGSGKTSVFSRITSNQFSYHYNQTTSVKIGSVVKKINVPAECLVSLSLWDIPGLEDLDLRKSYYKDIDAAVLVVNISDLEDIAEAVVLKKALIDLTETESKLITFDIMKHADKSSENSTAEFPNSDEEQLKEDVNTNKVQEMSQEDSNGINNIEEKCEKAISPNDVPPEHSEELIESENREDTCVNVETVSCEKQLIKKVSDIPTLLLGSKVDQLLIDEEQVELHPNVGALADACKEANCTGWVPVSAKENNRSIDQAFTSFLRFLVAKKLRMEQSAGLAKGLGMIQPVVPLFVPPHTSATNLRDQSQPLEDVNFLRLPLIHHEQVDAEYEIIRKLIGKVRRGYRDWKLSYRRFRKCAADNKIASSTCSVEGLVLNIKDELPENSLKGIEFQGWVKLELDSEIADTDQVNDAVLEVLDAFNYELFPNASFVATTVKNAMITIKDCKDVLSTLHIPAASVDQARANNKEISCLLNMCESSTAQVNTIRKAVEVALVW